MTHRRSFLKTLAAGAAALVVPFKARARTPAWPGDDSFAVRGVQYPDRFVAVDRIVDERDWPAIRAAKEIEIRSCVANIESGFDMGKIRSLILDRNTITIEKDGWLVSIPQECRSHLSVCHNVIHPVDSSRALIEGRIPGPFGGNLFLADPVAHGCFSANL